MRAFTLFSLGLGGAGVATGAGFAINNYIKPKTNEVITENIREHIERSNKSKNKVFLITGRVDLEDIKTKYHDSKDTNRPKPKNKDGSDVTKENLVKWCSDNVNSKFNSEQGALYKSIISWCFINSNSLEQEMASDGKQIYSIKGDTDPEWQNAWNDYSSKKTALTTIKTSSTTSKLNESDKGEGGKALHAWCTENKSKKLYEDGMEETYELFKLWCTKPKG